MRLVAQEQAKYINTITEHIPTIRILSSYSEKYFIIESLIPVVASQFTTTRK